MVQFYLECIKPDKIFSFPFKTMTGEWVRQETGAVRKAAKKTCEFYAECDVINKIGI